MTTDPLELQHLYPGMTGLIMCLKIGHIYLYLSYI